MTTNIKIFDNRVLIVQVIISNLNHLSKNADLFLSKWEDLNAVNVIFKLIERMPIIKLTGYFIISMISSDGVIEDLDSVIRLFTKCINKCAEDFARTQELDRIEGEILIDGKVEKCKSYISVFTENGVPTSILSILTSLYSLSINSKFKSQFYSSKTKNDLKVILFNGNKYEQIKTLDLLIQLSFDNFILSELAKDQELAAFLKSGSNNDSINKRIKYLNWNIYGDEKVAMKPVPTLDDQRIIHNNMVSDATRHKVAQQRFTSKPFSHIDNKINNHSSPNEETKFIMISCDIYDLLSKDMCLKIKEKLEIRKHTVWIDTGKIW